ncbi:hypothetical protein GGI56_002370 [Agrobacterium tumefaciens]|nr:hypothetical protein [Agrobacterium radiobacter]
MPPFRFSSAKTQNLPPEPGLTDDLCNTVRKWP